MPPLTGRRIFRLFWRSVSFSSSLSSCSPVNHSETYFLPPRASISALTATSHECISSGLSKTRRRVRAIRGPRGRNPNRENRGLPPSTVTVLVVASSSKCWVTCRTQCLPGIASLANATDLGPSFIIFSGSLSNFPSPAYWRR